MNARHWTGVFYPVPSVYRTAQVACRSYAPKVLNLDQRLFGNVFSKQRLERSANEKHWWTIAIVNCTRAEQTNQKARDNYCVRYKEKALGAMLKGLFSVGDPDETRTRDPKRDRLVF